MYLLITEDEAAEMRVNAPQWLVDRLDGAQPQPPAGEREAAMPDEGVTRAFYVGARVRFARPEREQPALRGRDFCLLNFGQGHFVIEDWDKRGQLELMFFEGSVYERLAMDDRQNPRGRHVR